MHLHTAIVANRPVGTITAMELLANSPHSSPITIPRLLRTGCTIAQWNPPGCGKRHENATHYAKLRSITPPLPYSSFPGE